MSAIHTRTVWSPLPVARKRPSRLNATHHTTSWCLVSGGPRGWPVSAFHMRTERSKPAEASRRPSGLNATLLTPP